MSAEMRSQVQMLVPKVNSERAGLKGEIATHERDVQVDKPERETGGGIGLGYSLAP